MLDFKNRKYIKEKKIYIKNQIILIVLLFKTTLLFSNGLWWLKKKGKSQLIPGWLQRAGQSRARREERDVSRRTASRLSPAPAQSELDQPGLRSCDVHLGNLGLVSCPLTRRQTSTPQHLNSQTETETNTGTGIVLRRIQDCGCKAVTVTSSNICSQLFLYSFLNGRLLSSGSSTSTIILTT